MRTIDDVTARKIWRILVAEGGAVGYGGDPEDYFVKHVTKPSFSEFRLNGKLGFGFKFWNNCGRWYVNCYREDIERHPEWQVTIDKINHLLSEL